MKAEEFIKKNNLSKHIKGTTKGLSEHFFSTKAMLEDYANKRVIDELELIVKEINSFTATNRIEKRLLKTIKELKQ